MLIKAGYIVLALGVLMVILSFVLSKRKDIPGLKREYQMITTTGHAYRYKGSGQREDIFTGELEQEPSVGKETAELINEVKKEKHVDDEWERAAPTNDGQTEYLDIDDNGQTEYLNGQELLANEEEVTEDETTGVLTIDDKTEYGQTEVLSVDDLEEVKQ